MKNSPAIHHLVLKNVPIFEQLQLEEALLRIGSHNYCLINHQSSPAIVMGISGKAEELIDEAEYQKRPVPVIRRFSGGGCVLINRETLLLTFIFNRHEVDVGTCPKRVLGWTEHFLRPVFSHIDFRVQENDYCLGDKKFGGNAQYITKSRWLHHTSLLWDYCPEEMKVLKLPLKIPEYRQRREHDDFLTRLNAHFSSKEEFFHRIKHELSNRYAIIEETAEEIYPLLQHPHRKSTELVLCGATDCRTQS